MRAGKIASMVLILIVTAVALAARVVICPMLGVEAGTTAGAATGFAVIVAAIASMILIPLGLVFDAAVVKLSRQMDTGSPDVASRPGTSVFHRWLQPVARQLTGSMEQLWQQEQSLRTQVTELEVKHRVSEAGRRQTEAVLNALRDAVLVTDAFDEIVMANQAAAAVLGFDLKTGIRRPIDDVVHDQKLRQLIRDARNTADFTNARHVEHSLATAKPDHAATVASTSRSDRSAERGFALTKPVAEPERVFELTLGCVQNHRHEVGGVVTILHDLTREREVSQMKSDFVSKASHELRTPLSSIRAYVEMLVDGEAGDEKSRQEFYRIIQGEADRLGRLIDNMLNISRIEAGIIQIERENVDIKALVHRAVHTLQPQADEKGITLHSRLAETDLCVEGDADMLYQVVLNLLSNAVKYTPGKEQGSDSGPARVDGNGIEIRLGGGPRITISADSDNLTRSVLVSFADTGLGIPPDSLPKLFDKFYRVENYKRMAKGTGLGLSLCKHIVETVHHGQIGVDSKVGMGSKFWFSVPMRYAGSKAAA